MLDPARIDDAARRGREVPDLIASFKAVDSRRKDLQRTLDELRARRNAANQLVSTMRGTMVPTEVFDMAVQERDSLRKPKGK